MDSLSGSWDTVRRALEKAREAQKKKSRSEKSLQRECCPLPSVGHNREFKVGDKVYLSTKFLNLRQSCKKLGLKYIDPFPLCTDY